LSTQDAYVIDALGLLKMLITYYLILGSIFYVLRVLTIAKGGGCSLKVFITIIDV
jgi:hypothetical protein